MSPLRVLRPLHDYRPHPKALMVVPFALIAVVTVLDITTSPDVHLGPFLVAAPALTASFAGARATAFVGAVAVLAQTLVSVVRTSISDLNHTYQIIALFLISVFVTFFAHLREQHALELTHLRSVAQVVQRVVMPPLPERSGTLRIASLYLAAEAEAQLGGDLYAIARTAGGTRVIIGDVRGKGLEAMGEAAQVLGAFRALAHQEPDLPRAVAQLEATVAADREFTSEGDGEGARRRSDRGRPRHPGPRRGPPPGQLRPSAAPAAAVRAGAPARRPGSRVASRPGGPRRIRFHAADVPLRRR